MAVNMDMTIPRPSVRAKPLTAEVPSQKSTIAVMIEEMLESRIESHALRKPSCKASDILFPRFSSSLVRSNISTLASTAMPIDKIKPAKPAAVNVTGITLKIVSERRI